MPDSRLNKIIYSFESSYEDPTEQGIIHIPTAFDHQ